MPIFNVRPQKELPQKRRVESSETSEKEVADANDNSRGEIRNEPASDPWIIGSSIVRRNEPDDED